MIAANGWYAVYLGAMGLLFIGLGIPLVLDRIPMNAWYGVRFKVAFHSPEMWYALNRYGARQLIGAGIVLLVDAVAVLFVPLGTGGMTNALILLLPLGMASIGAAITYRYAKRRSREMELDR